MTPHLEVLDPAQQTVLRAMAEPCRAAGFYLGGGTGIALHLGHRRSVDLDWFTPGSIEDPLRLAAGMRGQGVDIENPSPSRGTLHGSVGGVRVSLLEYRYPLLGAIAEIEGLAAPIAALEDLAAMKLAAVAQRGSRRDFIDVHALALGFRPLPELLDAYRRKYATDDVAPVIHALSHFDDADKERQPALLRDVDWAVVKSDVTGWIRDL